jgi:hypothetical protein
VLQFDLVKAHFHVVQEYISIRRFNTARTSQALFFSAGISGMALSHRLTGNNRLFCYAPV